MMSSVAQLRTLCRANELPLYGRRADLIRRLTAPDKDKVRRRGVHRPPELGTFDFIDQKDGDRIYSAAPHRAKVMGEFVEHKVAKEVSDGRLKSIQHQLRTFEGFLCMNHPQEFTFEDLTLLDCTRFRNWLKKEREMKPRTRKVVAITIRDFLRFAITGRLSGEHPGISEPLKVGTLREEKQSDNVREIPFEEYAEIRKGLGRIRDKTILALLYDSGCRIGEILALRVVDFKSDSGTWLHIPESKNGLARDVLLVESVHDLRSWMNSFPMRDNPDSYLFGSERCNYSNPLSSSTFYNNFYPALEAAGLKGVVSAHTFRHNRALQFAKAGIQEEVMRMHFGWEKGSDMPSYYIQLLGKDVRVAVMKARGLGHLLPPEEEDTGSSDTFPCAKCGNYQPRTSAFCSICGGGLSIEAVEKGKDAMSFLNNLPPEQHTEATAMIMMIVRASKNPEIRELLEDLGNKFEPGEGWVSTEE